MGPGWPPLAWQPLLWQRVGEKIRPGAAEATGVPGFCEHRGLDSSPAGAPLSLLR